MKNFIIIVICYATSSIALAQQWGQLDNFPGSSRDDGVSFTIGQYAYCGSGLDANFDVKGDFYAFDLISETWLPISSLPQGEERQYSTAQGINGYGYVFGGVDVQGNFLNDLWRYDPVSDNWVELPSLPSYGRGGAMSAVIADKFYVYGGRKNNLVASDELWVYDPQSNAWTQKSSNFIGKGCWRGLFVGHGTQAIAMFGVDSTNTLENQVYVYHSVSDSWALWVSDTVAPRKYPAYAKYGNQLYIYGGDIDSTDYMNSTCKLNLSSGQWTMLNDLPSTSRRGGMAFASSTDFYLTCGVSSFSRLNETWVARHIVSLIDKENDEVLIHFNSDDNILSSNHKIQSLTLYSSDGRIIIPERVNDSSYDLGGLNRGVYFYSVQARDKEARGKVLLIH